MTLLALVCLLLMVGVGLWGLSRLTMIDANIKQLIYVIVVVALCLYLLSSFGGSSGWNPRLW